jgi:uncharacterized membrane protein (DUF373 family)
MVYLKEHSISVGVAVEVAIVSVLREVVVHGVLEISWIQTIAICGLLFILGGLLIVCAKTPHMDCMSANTKFCPIRDKGTHNKITFNYLQKYDDNQPLGKE